MSKKEIVTIDGQPYDAVTGLQVDGSTSDHSEVIVHHASQKIPATSLHTTPQRSTTLHRKVTKRPTHTRTEIFKHQQKSHRVAMDIHPRVNKFAPHPVAVVASMTPKITDIGPAVHPHVAKAHAQSAAKAAPQTSVTAAAIKDEAIKTAVAATNKKPPLRERLFPKQRATAVLSATLAVVLIAGYLTYINMPSLSVRVAAAQAGIDANYPNYRPDGYALNGPVTYTDGRVSMNFKANAGSQNFTVNQSKSGWDSDAVLDNYVTPHATNGYIPYTERGLTIYSYDNDAAWVNAGILYTIEGNAPLSSEQVRRIATSLL